MGTRKAKEGSEIASSCFLDNGEDWRHWVDMEQYPYIRKISPWDVEHRGGCFTLTIDIQDSQNQF